MLKQPDPAMVQPFVFPELLAFKNEIAADRIFRMTIIGKPCPWARVRTNHGRFFNSSKMDSWQKAAAKQARTVWPARNGLLDGPLFLEVVFFFAPPKSLSKKVRQAALDGGYMPNVKPDLSNLLKNVEDALIGVVIVDDARITDITCRKRYASEARTEITLREYGVKP